MRVEGEESLVGLDHKKSIENLFTVLPSHAFNMVIF